MRLLSAAIPSKTDLFEQRALAARFQCRIETSLEAQFRRVENLLQTMDSLTRPRGGRR